MNDEIKKMPTGELLPAGAAEQVAVFSDGMEMRPMDANFNAATAIKQMEEKMEFFERSLAIAIKRTSTNDWKDLGGKMYLEATGAEKLKAPFGIYIKWFEIIVTEVEGYPLAECTMVAGCKYTGEESMFYGARWGGDDFYKNQSGVVDLADIKKASYTNCEGQSIRRMLGLRGVTQEEMKNIKQGDAPVGRVEYKKGDKKAGHNVDEDRREYLSECVMELCLHDSDVYPITLKELTGSKGVAGKRDFDGYTTVKTMKHQWAIDNAIEKAEKALTAAGLELPSKKSE